MAPAKDPSHKYFANGLCNFCKAKARPVPRDMRHHLSICAEAPNNVKSEFCLAKQFAVNLINRKRPLTPIPLSGKYFEFIKNFLYYD